MTSDIIPLQCPNCGSSDISIKQQLEPGYLLHCNSCDSSALVSLGNAPDIAAATAKPDIRPRRAHPSLPKLPPGLGEFGLSGRWRAGVAFGGAILFYIVGWFFEDTRYWLATEAIIIWAGVLPLWLLLWGALWQTPRPIWGLGLITGVLILLSHTVIPAVIRQRFIINDDYLGIAAMFAGTAVAGWLIGRGIHWGVRQARVKRREVGRNSSFDIG